MTAAVAQSHAQYRPVLNHCGEVRRGDLHRQHGLQTTPLARVLATRLGLCL